MYGSQNDVTYILRHGMTMAEALMGEEHAMDKVLCLRKLNTAVVWFLHRVM